MEVKNYNLQNNLCFKIKILFLKNFCNHPKKRMQAERMRIGAGYNPSQNLNSTLEGESDYIVIWWGVS